LKFTFFIFDSVILVAWLRPGRPGFYSRQGKEFFSFPSRSDQLCSPTSLIY